MTKLKAKLFPLFIFFVTFFGTDASLLLDRDANKKSPKDIPLTNATPKDGETFIKDGEEYAFKKIIKDFSKEKREERRKVGLCSYNLHLSLRDDLRIHIKREGFFDESVGKLLFDNLCGNLPEIKELRRLMTSKIEEGYDVDYQKSVIKNMYKIEFRKWTKELRMELEKRTKSKNPDHFVGVWERRGRQMAVGITDNQHINIQRGVVRDMLYKDSNPFVKGLSYVVRGVDELDYWAVRGLRFIGLSMSRAIGNSAKEAEKMEELRNQEDRSTTDSFFRITSKAGNLFKAVAGVGALAFLGGIIFSENMRKFATKVFFETVKLAKNCVKEIAKFVSENKKIFLMFIPAIFFGAGAGWGIKKLLLGAGFPYDFSASMGVLFGILVMFLVAFLIEKALEWYYDDDDVSTKTKIEIKRKRKRKMLQTYIYLFVSGLAIVYLMVDIFYLQNRGISDLDKLFNESIYKN